MGTDSVRAANAEVWLPVEGYADLYEVSNLGKVRSLRLSRDGGLIKGCVHNGYRRVYLCRNGGKLHAAVHRLVCLAFHGPAPLGHEVGHIDGTRSNNHAENLAWVTRSENMLQAAGHGTLVVPRPTQSQYLRGAQHPQFKFGQDARDRVSALRRAGYSTRRIAEASGVSETSVRRLLAQVEIANG